MHGDRRADGLELADGVDRRLRRDGLDVAVLQRLDLAGVVDRIDLRAALATLPPRERRVLTWRFGDDLTQVQIGERLGVSQMQVSRILRRALDRLRSLLTSDETPVAA